MENSSSDYYNVLFFFLTVHWKVLWGTENGSSMASLRKPPFTFMSQLCSPIHEQMILWNEPLISISRSTFFKQPFKNTLKLKGVVHF